MRKTALRIKDETERLAQVGNRRTSDDGTERRIYFENIPTWYGLLTTHASVAATSASATLNGARISNNKAAALAAKLNEAIVWYDCDTGWFIGRRIDGADLIIVVNAIKKAVGICQMSGGDED
ncbi:MAG: hypothetical protein KGL39_20755 [Patescibacteria group bacterium]|nr:hypothetical protein [Patescibacteria group bacterium]